MCEENNLKRNRSGTNSGFLTVLYEAEPEFDSRGRPRRMWKCKCECGNLVTVRDDSLNGRTKSCGCLQRKKASEFLAGNKYRIKDGESKERLHNIWSLMKYRCFNTNSPAYCNYGGRGIKVCDEWLSEEGYLKFKQWALLNGYNDNLSIDRIDNNGNYCPENCRWVNKETQNNNTRRNHLVEWNNELHTVAEWSKITGIDKRVIYSRLYRQWEAERIFSQPVRKSSKHI